MELELENKELQEKVIYFENSVQQAIGLNNKNQVSSQEEIKNLLAQIRQ
eukprot:CAMPEP_0170527138 /NCGR_PEP_ID=MMETSP0209-20121228/12596_1 /TAXON_ID=665100 ORGANISM="Litonotus pictus, Strain P1" /NCGR_SAMPLE_ID=MMETSP0209 /ASSEMBLY_ACC=CAM_ASM_000301 /LENGTH=48 /DNA_ID= /DNA_START= /DNA_END= /DNA_ORIENTATION=